MSTPKFTQGPWRPHQVEARTIVAGKPGIAIALVDAGSRSVEENDANFAICLAAPEMYEALNAIRDALCEMELNTPFGSPLMYAVLKSNTAIAKAEGKP